MPLRDLKRPALHDADRTDSAAPNPAWPRSLLGLQLHAPLDQRPGGRQPLLTRAHQQAGELRWWCGLPSSLATAAATTLLRQPPPPPPPPALAAGALPAAHNFPLPDTHLVASHTVPRAERYKQRAARSMAEQPKRPRICLVAGATRGLGGCLGGQGCTRLYSAPLDCHGVVSPRFWSYMVATLTRRTARRAQVPGALHTPVAPAPQPRLQARRCRWPMRARAPAWCWWAPSRTRLNWRRQGPLFCFLWFRCIGCCRREPLRLGKECG